MLKVEDKIHMEGKVVEVKGGNEKENKPGKGERIGEGVKKKYQS